MYGDSLPRIRWGMQDEAVWRPPTDVYETNDSVVVTVEIAGLSEGDYEIALTGRLLDIQGERRDPLEKLAYQQMEIRYGRFRTQVQLPWALEPGGQSATYEKGLLRIVLHKAQTRRIQIRSDEEAERT